MYWESSISSNSKNLPEACSHSGKSPCDWVTHQDQLSSIGIHPIAVYKEKNPLGPEEDKTR